MSADASGATARRTKRWSIGGGKFLEPADGCGQLVLLAIRHMGADGSPFGTGPTKLEAPGRSGSATAVSDLFLYILLGEYTGDGREYQAGSRSIKHPQASASTRLFLGFVYGK
jgi:hypothetical protein